MELEYEPNVRHDQSALWDVVSIMDIIFRHPMRHGYSGISELWYIQAPKARTKRNDNVPTKNFFGESLDIREGITVRKIRKTIRANDSVNLCLCLLLDLREECQSQEQRVDSRNGLAMPRVNATYRKNFITYGVSTAYIPIQLTLIPRGYLDVPEYKEAADHFTT